MHSSIDCTCEFPSLPVAPGRSRSFVFVRVRSRSFPSFASIPAVPNYGFAIDLRKCIGCHACTIACKSEHDIPVGVNRCWVKTVEKGTFPQTQRLFFPVLCNQCVDAPCLNICPTGALYKRRDGIVDLNGDSCIGCRACMAACPYDQLFIDPNTRTAEKCNFCANRIENRLEPACVSVCPTECRIFGDLDDPTSEVAQIVQREAFMVRKPEKGTGPKIFYLGADEAAIRPEIAARPFMFREGQVHLRPLGSPDPMDREPGDPRVDYDIPHKQAWGFDLVLYLLFKGISTGAMFLSALLWLLGDRTPLVGIAGPLISVLFAVATAVVLVIDLERPERFYYILTRPNWSSWLARGAFLLTAHSGLASLWLLGHWFGWFGLLTAIAPLAMAAAVGATAYTGFLFAQGLARDLWQGPHGTIDLIAQAAAEGSAAMLVAAYFVGGNLGTIEFLALTLAYSVLAHVSLLLIEHVFTPSPTLNHELAAHAIRRGAYSRLFWIGAVGLGGLAPLALVGLSAADAFAFPPLVAAAVVALIGGFAWEYIWVEAGQSVPNS
jgi:Fe-S-cluster-containing dehydrogenase component/formate-dependent nitrite reductase membrane component NrfD